MYKIILPAVFFCLFLVEKASAQSTETESESITGDATTLPYHQQEIQFDELPETVQTSFQESDYAQWEITRVIEHPTDEGTLYEITVSDGTVEETVRIAENGDIKSTE